VISLKRTSHTTSGSTHTSPFPAFGTGPVHGGASKVCSSNAAFTRRGCGAGVA